MIEIVVVTYNSEAPARPLAARFAQAGGTIGRSDDNLFVLPDPKHHVSRRQAAISSDGMQHWITNLSQANPTVLNGVELLSEVAQPLRAGDEIRIGLYVLQARAVAAAVATVPSASTTALPGPATTATRAPLPSHVPSHVPSQGALHGASHLPSHVPPRSSPPIQPGRPVSNPAAHATPAALQSPLQSPLQSSRVGPPPTMHPGFGSTPLQPPKSAAATGKTPAAAVDDNEGSAVPADPQALLQAFLDGAGIPSITLSSGLTPELMAMLGSLLGTAIEGTVDLLGLRALVKREVNADVTMVVVRNNNPLKFLPDGATVLTQMLRKRMPGFMGPVEAMQDAYDDLHAHQLGMMAGMQASLADLHRQFDPLAIERSTAPGSTFERMLPASRKARNWDRYCELYRSTGAALGNATESMAAKAFLSAYERASEHYQDKAANER